MNIKSETFFAIRRRNSDRKKLAVITTKDDADADHSGQYNLLLDFPPLDSNTNQAQAATSSGTGTDTKMRSSKPAVGSKKSKSKVSLKNPFGINDLSRLLRLPSDEVITFVWKHFATFSKVISQSVLEDRHLNVLVQVIGDKLCSISESHVEEVSKVQISLITLLTNNNFLAKIMNYTERLKATAHSKIKTNLPYCTSQKIQEHLFIYFEFVISRPFFLKLLPQDVLQSIKAAVRQIQLLKTEAPPAAVTQMPEIATKMKVIGNELQLLEVQNLTQWLKMPQDEVLKAFNLHRKQLSRLLSQSNLITDQLNLLVQIFGSKLCGATHFLSHQKRVMIKTYTKEFMCKLFNYTNWVGMGMGGYQMEGQNSNSESAFPLCSAMIIIENLFNYYNFLVTDEKLNTTKKYKRRMCLKDLLQNVQSAQRALQNIGKLKQKSSAVQNLEIKFDDLEVSLKLKLDAKNSKIPMVVAHIPVEAVKLPAKLTSSGKNKSKIVVKTEKSETYANIPESWDAGSLKQIEKLSPEDAVVLIASRFESFSKFIVQMNFYDFQLGLLIQIIGNKLCYKSTEALTGDRKKLLLLLIANYSFIQMLNSYFRMLVKNLSSGQKTTNRKRFSIELIRKICRFYNCILSSDLKAENVPVEHVEGNVQKAFAVLQDFQQHGDSSGLTGTNLRALQRAEDSFKDLNEFVEGIQSCTRNNNIVHKTQNQAQMQTNGSSFISKLQPKSIPAMYNIASQLGRLSLSNNSETINAQFEIEDCFPSWDLSSEEGSVDEDHEYTTEYNFVGIEEVPSKNEILADKGPSLKPMPVKGRHSSALVYLKDQYQLNREDFVAPLRKFLNSMLSQEEGFALGQKKSSSKIVRFYHGVRCYSKHSMTFDLSHQNTPRKQSKTCSVHFEFPQLSEADWAGNGWLLPESLVILSCDNFQTIYVATVTYWDEFELAKGFLNITWEGPQPPVLEGLNWVMAESEAYFVSYRYTLKALQLMAKPVPPGYDTPLFATYPMAKYIVEMSTDHVPPPKYLRETTQLLNFAALIPSNDLYETPPLAIASWPLCSDVEMDSAQFSAFQSAVTQELCIIQGPPGTGKTYIGLQLMKLFLSNPSIFDAPILIVCRTNHALDQFLEGIVPIMENLEIPLKESLLRVGGGSESELLGDYIVTHRRITKDLKLFSETYENVPLPSFMSTSNELESLRGESYALRSLLEELQRVESLTDLDELITNRAYLTDMIDAELEFGLDILFGLEDDSYVPNFVAKATAYIKSELEVSKINIGIVSDQENYRGNGKPASRQKERQAGIVIGMTTCGAAKHTNWLRFMQPRIVIVEEAAEVLESHIVTSITEHCEHLILIGDHKQLRPLTADHTMAMKYHLDVSLFERLIKNNLSWFCLETQHRMRPEISKLLVPTIYEKLSDHADVMDLPDVAGFAKNLFFINHLEPEQEEVDTVSKSNAFEAHYATALTRHLILQDYKPEQITVLIMYNGQKTLVEHLMRAQGEPLCSVKVETVDSYQGEENDIIILSLVRSNLRSDIGFLKIENRICVALSRARQGFYILGNMNCLVKSRSKMWAQISGELHRQRSIGDLLELRCQVHGDSYHIITPEDFLTKAPDGGCGKMCGKVLPNCGHKCPKYCHVIDQDHANYRCQVQVSAELKCGHIGYIECYKKRQGRARKDDDLSENSDSEGSDTEEDEDDDGDLDLENYVSECNKQCTRSCDLGHPCATSHLCYQNCKPCRERVDKLLPCGHLFKNVACYIDISVLKSMHSCDPNISDS